MGMFDNDDHWYDPAGSYIPPDPEFEKSVESVKHDFAKMKEMLKLDDEAPLKRIEITRADILEPAPDVDMFAYTCEIVDKCMVYFVQQEDNFLIEQIIALAKSEGVTHLYLIDKEFVLTAIRNEMERRKKEDFKS